MMEYISALLTSLDRMTGVENSIVYIAISLLCVICHSYFNSTPKYTPEEEEEEEQPPKPRNFTIEQLRNFDGSKDEKTDETKPVYLSLAGTVFDVTKGKEYYGQGGPYEMFAGRECGVALAKMSFDEKDLDDVAGCDKLVFGEKNTLEGWIEKFTHFRPYNIVGKLIPDDILPSKERTVTVEMLAENNGKGDVPKGYATAPLYLAAGGKVFDVSFGGVEFYGEGGPYNRFVGKDASRALAKMSFDPADIENTNTSDLTEKEKKILDDWLTTFEKKKKYPVVGSYKN